MTKTPTSPRRSSRGGAARSRTASPRDILTKELHRGTWILVALLSTLRPRYGREIVAVFHSHDLRIHEMTLYPLLRRLERQGLLSSKWVLPNSTCRHARRYYSLTAAGRKVLAAALADWKQTNNTVEAIQASSLDPREP